MKNVLTQKDFENYGVVADHCDNKKLNIAINEALDFDLCSVFKKCEVEIKVLIKNVLLYDPESEGIPPTEFETALVNGNIFSHDSRNYENLGLKRGLIYYAYARYLLINELNDSAVGNKTKDFSFSIPKTANELEQMSNKYRNLGKACFVSSLEWIALNEKEFPQLANCLDLDLCACRIDNKQSKCDIETKGYGNMGSNIYKNPRR